MAFTESNFEDLPLAAKRRIDAVCERFERAWRSGRPRLESYCYSVPVNEQAILLSELLHIELEFRRKAGDAPSAEEYRQRFPDREEVIQTVFPTPSPTDTAGSYHDQATILNRDKANIPPQVPGYEILGDLGQGGMGIVFKARHLKLNRLVALKFILAGSDAEHKQRRFRQEAELVARLRHPNIVQIYELGEIDGQLYLALEYADGGSLRERLSGPSEPRFVVQILEPLARAAQHAHRLGVIHRDIKPANILLTIGGDSITASGRHLPDLSALPNLPEGFDFTPPLSTCTPKLTDFGLARHLDKEQASAEPNLPGGTPAYMAPEQAMGEEPSQAVDVWALGATMYELLTGQPPFRAETAAETLRAVLMQNPPPPSAVNPKVPADLDAICMKCLQKNPADRYAGARELAQDLRRYLAGESVAPAQVSLVERATKWARQRPALALGLAAAVLLGIAVLAAFVGAVVSARLG